MDNNIKDNHRPKPIVLVVVDGWGIAQPYSGNAISQANTLNISTLIARYPAMTLRASGEAVGLPWGEPGNSEVGHLNLGLGRIVYQDLPRINKAISDNSFFSNVALVKAIDRAKEKKSKLHLVGLVSDGGVHSSIEHLEALLILVKEKGLKDVFIHAILDGRDTPYKSGVDFIKQVIRFSSEYGSGEIATIAGRFYSLDRDNHWDRIAKSYLAMTTGEGKRSDDPVKAIEESYNKKIYDEELVPTTITKNGKPVALVAEGDSLIFFNFRADRARQLTKAFVLPGFEKLPERKYVRDLFFVCFTEYEKDLPAEIAFPPTSARDTLGDVLAKNNLKQLRISETEKYAHVTYFFNGGREEKSPGEDHVLVPSPQVASYDLTPEMSAIKITDQLIAFIKQDIYDFILVNFANADMVGHTGNIKAAVKAIETVDKCLKRLAEIVLDKNGVLMVTADHGNAENMFNMQTGEIDKEHTADPVPFILVGKQFEGKTIGFRDTPGSDLSLLKPQGILSDVAPTILKILDLKKPPEMTGRSLL